MKGEYVLIVWPWIQQLMEYPWFNDECYLMQGFEGQEHFDSSYFVPKERLDELGEDTLEKLF